MRWKDPFFMGILAHTKMWVLKVDKQCPGQPCKGQLLSVPSTWGPF